MQTVDGRVAGYSLYRFDPATRVGLVEPVRVEDEYARLGLARAMLTVGIDRLARGGAQRIKMGFESEAVAALYQGVGVPTYLDRHLVRGTRGATQLSGRAIRAMTHRVVAAATAAMSLRGRQAAGPKPSRPRRQRASTASLSSRLSLWGLRTA